MSAQVTTFSRSEATTPVNDTHPADMTGDVVNLASFRASRCPEAAPAGNDLFSDEPRPIIRSKQQLIDYVFSRTGLSPAYRSAFLLGFGAATDLAQDEIDRLLAENRRLRKRRP